MGNKNYRRRRQAAAILRESEERLTNLLAEQASYNEGRQYVIAGNKNMPKKGNTRVINLSLQRTSKTLRHDIEQEIVRTKEEIAAFKEILSRKGTVIYGTMIK